MAIPAPRAGCAALITGASSGIGAALARELCARGHDAILVARRRERLEELAAELRAAHGRRVEVLSCDLSDLGARAGMLDELQALGLTVDVLVLCAGFGMGGELIAEDPERITMMVRTNVEAVMALSRALVPGMAERGEGAVLLVSSIAGFQPMPNFGAYAATKAAVTSFGETLHAELKPRGVTATVLAPGGVRTDFASVAGMLEAERRTPGALMIDPQPCARAALDGLERGRRIVIPGRGVRAFVWFGTHAPRAIWLPICRRMLA